MILIQQLLRRMLPKSPTVQSNVILRIMAERRRQDEKWGSQRHLSRDRWNTILTEEVGEIANAILEEDTDNLKVELIQVAAVCVAFAEALEDGR